MVKLAVDTIYSYNNISRLAWLPKKKRSLSLLKKMSIDNVAIMKSLVLKRDVSEIYQEYVIKHCAQFPNTPAMKKSLFYTVTILITGGSKKQQIRAGVDYIKVNHHTDNYQLVDKIIDIVAPASDADQTVREQLYLQRSTVFTFLSYTYAHHVLEGVRHQCEPTFDEFKQSRHTANDHEMNVRHLYHNIVQLVDDLNDQSNSKHQQIIQLVKNQLEICKTINGYIAPDGKLLHVHLTYPNLP